MRAKCIVGRVWEDARKIQDHDKSSHRDEETKLAKVQASPFASKPRVNTAGPVFDQGFRIEFPGASSATLKGDDMNVPARISACAVFAHIVLTACGGGGDAPGREERQAGQE